ncbi:MAG: alkaline phosphatase family protein [Deltaproteobacteria bacterium]|nr:alkaline phosphatase family protein [Deltaproteobacteria bacterium]MBW2086196.1 alkaline phosphatase family protein [Deltaproteobacteria bacterium]
MNEGPSRPKVVILGLDGVGWSLIQALTAEGVMPHLKALVRDSICGEMLSTLPEISPVAWTTFFTARNPGEHGIFGFTEFKGPGYQVRLNGSGQIQAPTLWDWLGLKNFRSVVLNVPMTYPAQPLSGAMVSGFIAASLQRAGYPAWVADYLHGIGYRLEADFETVHQDRQTFLEELNLILKSRGTLLERFWPLDWDFFFLVVTGTDRLNHFFYQEYKDQGPIHRHFLDFYHEVDKLIGRFYDLASDLVVQGNEDLCLVMLSDHGFTPVKEEFHLNRWLARHGYQNHVGPEARVLALDPTRVYFNRSPRFPEGRVRSAEAHDLALELTASLKAEPAVAEVVPRSELYTGTALDIAPDLVIQPATGFEFKAKFTSGPIYSSSLLQGTHTRKDAFYLAHDFSGRTRKLDIRDILDLAKFVFMRFNLDLKEGAS